MKKLLIYQMIPKCGTHTMYEYFSNIKPHPPKRIWLHNELTYTSGDIKCPDKYTFLFSYFLCRFADNVAYLKSNYDDDYIRSAEYAVTYSPATMHEYIDRECAYATLLREPLDRAQSFYYWIKTKFPENHSFRILANELDFVEFHKKFIPNNFMTLMLSGMWYESLHGHRIALDKAIENIEKKYALIASLDKYNLFIEKFEELTGWHKQERVEKQHVNKERSNPNELTKSQVESMREYDALDFELYEFLKNHNGLICNI